MRDLARWSFYPKMIKALFILHIAKILWHFDERCSIVYILKINSILALAMALCVAMIAFVRLPSLKVSVLLLFGLLVYDVFWVSSQPVLL